MTEIKQPMYFLYLFDTGVIAIFSLKFVKYWIVPQCLALTDTQSLETISDKHAIALGSLMTEIS